MADGRAVFATNEIDYEGVSFQFGSTILFNALQSNGSASAGLAVTMSGDGIVDLCADADSVVGKLRKVEADGWCTVQVDGGVTLPGGSGATLTAGTKICGALGAASARGYIRSIAPATLAEVAKGRHTIYSGATPTAVQVMLD